MPRLDPDKALTQRRVKNPFLEAPKIDSPYQFPAAVKENLIHDLRDSQNAENAYRFALHIARYHTRNFNLLSEKWFTLIQEKMPKNENLAGMTRDQVRGCITTLMRIGFIEKLEISKTVRMTVNSMKQPHKVRCLYRFCEPYRKAFLEANDIVIKAAQERKAERRDNSPFIPTERHALSSPGTQYIYTCSLKGGLKEDRIMKKHPFTPPKFNNIEILDSLDNKKVCKPRISYLKKPSWLKRRIQRKRNSVLKRNTIYGNDVSGVNFLREGFKEPEPVIYEKDDYAGIQVFETEEEEKRAKLRVQRSNFLFA